MPVITVRRRDSVVEVIDNTTHVGIRVLDYDRALELATLIRYKARGVYTPERVAIDSSLAVRRDGDAIVIEIKGTTFLTLTLEQAMEIGDAIHGKAKEVEEQAHAQDVINDQATLVRAGYTLGMSNRQDIKDEAYKEAQWGDLRRYMPQPRQWPNIGHITVVKEPLK